MLPLDMDAAPPVDLVWTQTPGGEDCIGQSELGAKVQAALGHSGLVPTRAGEPGHPVVRGSVGRGPPGYGWIAVVEVRRGNAPPLRRELGLNAPGCRQLDEAIVLVVALLLDAAVLSPPPLTIVSPGRAISVSVGPDVAVAWGMVPGLSLGFGLVSEAEIGALWPIALSAHDWPASRAMAGAWGGQIGALTFGAAICPVALSRNAWEIFGCAGASGGKVDSAGISLDRPLGSARPYVQIDAQVGFHLRIAAYLVARLGLGASFPLTQYTYVFGQPDQSVHDVFHTSVIVPVGQVAIELRTPR